MAELKIKADSGGGTVSLKGPATTTSNAAVQLTLPVDDGTANQVLTTNGSGALSWAAPVIADDSLTEAKLDIHAAPSGTDKFLGYTSNGMEWAVPGGGKVLQVVTSTKLDGFSTTSDQVNIDGTDQAGSGSVWCCKITPSAATSKVLFLGTITGHHTTFHGGIWTFRDSTEIAYAAASGGRQRATYSMGVGSSDSSTRNFTQALGLNWLDSPSSTSELTYKFQVGDHGEGGTMYINRTANPDDWAGNWLSISSIVLMEIGA